MMADADPDQSTSTVAAPESSPAVKKAASRKRRSLAPPKPNTPARGNNPESGSNVILPTPRQSVEPSVEPFAEPPEPRAAPLTEIAENDDGANDQDQEERPSADDTVTQIKPIRAMDTILEKPMDIVVKSRAMAMPTVEETGPKNRMVITYLILTNFKSYAGRQEVGPFHASFSSVVGPNGSGKSNVIDSLLFVFGFRASKMRQGKISALIHNSAQYPNLDHCEVAVHFQEVTDLVSLLGSLIVNIHEVLLTRHVARRWYPGRSRLPDRHFKESVQEQLEQILHQWKRVQFHHGHYPPPCSWH